MSVAAGISDHRGWAVVVCIGARDGVPFVADRRRIELVDDDVESQPFHHAGASQAPAQVESLVTRLRASAGARAQAALSLLRDELHAPLIAVALEEERLALPGSVAEVLESQPQMIAADGALYRSALRAAAERLGAEVIVLPRGSELEHAAAALAAPNDQVDALLGELGRELGPPWRKEHRKAAAAAIAALASRLPLRLPDLDREENA